MIRHRIEDALLLALTTATACGSSSACLALPCPISTAVVVTVTAPGGGKIPGAFIRVNGAQQQQPCDQSASVTTCTVVGSAGSYAIEVGATGYTTKTTTATYTEIQSRSCGCSTGEAARVTVILAPVAAA